jgi:hypothetical protein
MLGAGGMGAMMMMSAAASRSSSSSTTSEPQIPPAKVAAETAPAVEEAVTPEVEEVVEAIPLAATPLATTQAAAGPAAEISAAKPEAAQAPEAGERERVALALDEPPEAEARAN